MSAPVDVLKAMRVAEAYCYDAGASNAAKNLRAAVAALIAERDALRAEVGQQPAPVDLDFAEWIAKELPAGTVIGDPAWWANRFARQYAKRARQSTNTCPECVYTGPMQGKTQCPLCAMRVEQQPAPVVDDAMRELIEQRDTLLNALKQALPHVEHAYHTHEDLGGSFWIDVVGCRNAIARAQGVQS